MMRSRKPSPAMLVALLALFVALGGSSYAALTLPKGSVGSKQLRKNAVTSPKVKPGSLLLSDFRASQRALLVGPQGAPGPKGDTGDTGDTGATGDKGEPGLNGTNGVDGATNVTRRIGPLSDDILADQSGVAAAMCDAGERAVGGGGIPWSGSLADPEMTESSPRINGEAEEIGVPVGWTVRYNNGDSNNDNMGAITVRAYVVCVAP
jgi:Collagen triple helix repeat (20 copies)